MNDPTPTHQPKTVLIADRHAAVRVLLAVILGDEGYALYHADNGRDALQLARQHHPDLALLDAALPEIDGYAVARRLRADGTRGTKLVLLNGRPHPGDEERARRCGADAYFLKPFRPFVLLAEVRKLIGQEAAKPHVVAGISQAAEQDLPGLPAPEAVS